MLLSEVSVQNKIYCLLLLPSLKVMETKSMLYLVTEYASNGEMFSK